jgi:FtsZ-binding cell division protein ZapB
MDRDELIELLQDEIDHLKHENALLKECIRELEAPH